MKRIFLASVILAAMLLVGCASPATSPSKTTMTFETIGSKGSMVFITLVSPSPDAVSNEDLANRLREDWQNHLVAGNMIEVKVFDNKDAPKRWLDIWGSLATMSDQDWAKEQAQIFPHLIANYFKNKTSGLHQVEIMSRDTKGSIVRTIKF